MNLGLCFVVDHYVVKGRCNLPHQSEKFNPSICKILHFMLKYRQIGKGRYRKAQITRAAEKRKWKIKTRRETFSLLNKLHLYDSFGLITIANLKF